MHELSIALSIVDMAAEEAAARRPRRRRSSETRTAFWRGQGSATVSLRISP